MSLLQDLTWEQVEKEIKETGVALIPVGATEQHGHHLPMGSDTYASYEVAKRASEKESAIVVPAIPYGISSCHRSFQGTITLSTNTLFRVLTDICESLFRDGVKKFIFINGHGHNSPTLQAVMEDFKLMKGRDAHLFLIVWFVAGFKLTSDLWSTDPGDLPDGHAADLETSVMLSIKPDLVNMNKADKVVLSSLGNTNLRFTKSTSVLLKHYPIDITTMNYFKTFSESGVIGSPLNASKEKGDKVLDKVSDFLAELIRELKAI